MSSKQGISRMTKISNKTEKGIGVALERVNESHHRLM